MTAPPRPAATPARETTREPHLSAPGAISARRCARRAGAGGVAREGPGADRGRAGRRSTGGRPRSRPSWSGRTPRCTSRRLTASSAGAARSWSTRWRRSASRCDGLVCLDAGASTGGFTDVLLRRGAARVYAVDVGHGQLDWRLRSDPRVVVMERTNVRTLDALPEPIDLAVADVSFISLRLVLPAICRLARPARPIVDAGQAPVRGRQGPGAAGRRRPRPGRPPPRPARSLGLGAGERPDAARPDALADPWAGRQRRVPALAGQRARRPGRTPPAARRRGRSSRRRSPTCPHGRYHSARCRTLR